MTIAMPMLSKLQVTPTAADREVAAVWPLQALRQATLLAVAVALRCQMRALALALCLPCVAQVSSEPWPHADRRVADREYWCAAVRQPAVVAIQGIVVQTGSDSTTTV